LTAQINRLGHGIQPLGRCQLTSTLRIQPGRRGAAVHLVGDREDPLMHIYAKLGVNDRAAAVAEAFDRGLLIPRHLSS
jgi:hypothetical protein